IINPYNYTIEFISGKENVYADFLSRKPINIQPTPKEQVEVRVMFIAGEQIVNSTMVAMETKKDPVLSNVLDFTKNGWPEKPQPELQPYHTRRLELSHEDGILLCGTLEFEDETTGALRRSISRENVLSRCRRLFQIMDILQRMDWQKGEPLQTKLDRFLLTCRATSTGLGKSPSELLMNRQPRIRLSALRAKQSKNEVKIFQDNLDNQPKYSQNQAVFARNFGKGARWLPGVIVKIISPRNYDVKVGDVMWKRHEEQLRPRHIPSFENAEQLTRK
ncbi:Hypothetical predicted protein, partial [Paramuricea clavata]